MKKTILLFAGLAFLTFKNQAQTVTDYDGNVYNTVTIGTQTWMKENLRVTHYRNGILIPNDTALASTGVRCYYNNDSITNAPIYGALYNWYAVNNSNNLCPLGWHVPTDNDWKTLEMYLGMSQASADTLGLRGTDEGGKLKEGGNIHWNSPNTGATNSSNFSALPAGTRNMPGPHFNGMGNSTYFWSSTLYSINNNYPYTRGLSYNNSKIDRYYIYPQIDFPVRCIKDGGNKVDEINFNEKYKIYPNPANDIIYINCAEKKFIKMQVYNIIGECILQKELNNDTNGIDISSLSKGIYIIKLTGANWTVNRKLTKE